LYAILQTNCQGKLIMTITQSITTSNHIFVDNKGKSAFSKVITFEDDSGESTFSKVIVEVFPEANQNKAMLTFISSSPDAAADAKDFFQKYENFLPSITEVKAGTFTVKVALSSSITAIHFMQETGLITTELSRTIKQNYPNTVGTTSNLEEKIIYAPGVLHGWLQRGSTANTEAASNNNKNNNNSPPPAQPF